MAKTLAKDSARDDIWTMDNIRYKTIIFDLDGTLIDSMGDIAVAANRALESHGFPVHPADAYRFFVGDGLAVLARRIVPENASDEQAGQVAETFKHYYAQNWHETTRPYPGITDMLEFLSGHPINMAVLSNKPDEFTQIYVKRFFPDFDFKLVFGNRPSVQKKPAPDAALEIAKELECDTSKCLFVGDTNVDIRTGKAAGMTAMGVTWGFRDRIELEQSGADIIIDTPLQLRDYVFSTT